MRKHRNPLRRVFMLALVLAAALASWSCNGADGVGVGMGYPSRWGGGGSSGPPIFVGSPVY